MYPQQQEQQQQSTHMWRFNFPCRSFPTTPSVCCQKCRGFVLCFGFRILRLPCTFPYPLIHSFIHSLTHSNTQSLFHSFSSFLVSLFQFRFGFFYFILRHSATVVDIVWTLGHLSNFQSHIWRCHACVLFLLFSSIPKIKWANEIEKAFKAAGLEMGEIRALRVDFNKKETKIET